VTLTVAILKIIGWILLAVLFVVFVLIPLLLFKVALFAPHHYPRTVVIRRRW
jgi:hypothetical protein